MQRILLNAGAMSVNPDGIKATVDHFAGCRQVACIPYAGVGDLDDTVKLMQGYIPDIPFLAVHRSTDPATALQQADGIWVMGGNSFLLAHHLHALGLIEPVRRMVKAGVPYAGASAGANVAGPTICTTNDMPILRDPGPLDSFGLVPFQINPHYVDASAMPAGFRGETRETRIKEFLAMNDVAVVGLREGTWLDIRGPHMLLLGNATAVVFERGKAPREVQPGSDLSPLLLRKPRFDAPESPGISLP